MQEHSGGYSRPPSHMQAGNGQYSGHRCICKQGMGNTPGHHRICKQGMGGTLVPLHMQAGNGQLPATIAYASREWAVLPATIAYASRECQYSRPPSHMQTGMGSTPGRRQTFVVINTAAITLAHLPLRSEAIAPTITISNKTTTGTTTPDHLQTPNQAITMTVTAGTLDQRPNFEDTMVAFPGRHRISRCLKVNPTAGWKHQCIKITPRQLQTHH